jgi:hypothetical protein
MSVGAWGRRTRCPQNVAKNWGLASLDTSHPNTKLDFAIVLWLKTNCLGTLRGARYDGTLALTEEQNPFHRMSRTRGLTMTSFYNVNGRFAFFALAFFAWPAIAYPADANPAGDILAGQQPLDALIQERVAAARECLTSTRAAFERDTVTLDLVLTAIRDLRAAELDAAATSKERITANFRALTAARAVDSQISELHRVGARGGEADKYWQTKATRLEAEIRLAQAKFSGATDERGDTPQDQDKVDQKAALVRQYQQELNQLRRERLTAANEFMNAARAAYDTDTITLDILLTAIRERFAARVDAAEKDLAEQLAAHREFVASARAIEARIKALYEAGARGGEAEKYAHVRTTRLEAEIGLARFQQAQTSPPASVN